VSDGLSLMNVQMSNTSFKLGTVKIGERNYLGNDIHYPAEGKTGANCLLGTKVMVPVDGPVRENVGLLGSPCFEIPRATERDKSFLMNEEVRQHQLHKKNRHNLATMAIRLLCYWNLTFIALLLGYVAILYYPVYGVLSLMTFAVVITVVDILLLAFLERASLGFKNLEPKTVSIYDEQYWRHERYWKLSGTPLYMLFKGTPFKTFIARLMGTRMGKKVFDDGCYFIEKSMTVVGDYATLNDASILQGHSLEEGVFKSDYIKIGSGCTIGCNGFVHYGVTMGDRAVLDPDSFLMKGETVEAHAHWRGNPAKALRNSAPAAAVKEVAQPVASEPFALAKAA
jgi:non-ribosomal peptide synthetase-like protein